MGEPLFSQYDFSYKDFMVSLIGSHGWLFFQEFGGVFGCRNLFDGSEKLRLLRLFGHHQGIYYGHKSGAEVNIFARKQVYIELLPSNSIKADEILGKTVIYSFSRGVLVISKLSITDSYQEIESEISNDDTKINP